VKFHVSEVDGVQTRFVEMSTKWDKAHKCKLGNTKPRDPNEGVPQIYENPNDTLCPYHFVGFFCTLCPPTQERILCYKANKDLRREYQLTGKSYLYNDKLSVGVNGVTPVRKHMCKEFGFDDWECCTGHGMRKVGITTAMIHGDKNITKVILGASQHKSVKTSLIYQKPTEEMYQNYNRAILGNQVPSPPKRNNNNKKKRKQCSDTEESDVESEEEENKRVKKKRKVVECSEKRELVAVAPMEEEDDLCNYKPLPIHPSKLTSEHEWPAPPPSKISSTHSYSNENQSTLSGTSGNHLPVVSNMARLKELPPIVEARIDPDTNSRAISSLPGAGLRYDNEMQDLPSTSKAMAIRYPSAMGMHYPGTACSPIHQNHHHKMMNFQRN